MLGLPRQIIKTKRLVALFLAVIVVYLAQTPCIAADLQLQGFSYIQNKNFAKALECFNSALKERPNDWMLLQRVGCCHMELGHYDTAIASFQKSIEAGGLHAIQCNNMAAVYQRLGDTKKALSWLRLACSVDPAVAADPSVQAAISKLQDPENNPIGSPAAKDYLSGLSFAKGWRKAAMPLKVYVRQNIQIPQFYEKFVSIVRDSFDQWCKAADGCITYKLVTTKDTADVICDYTDRRELVSSHHELGIDGNTEMLVKQDRSPGPTNFVVLVKDGPTVPTFRKRELIKLCCLHEVGHALGMHGHSPNSHDVMFPCVTLNGNTVLSERDKATIRRIYQR